jgi:glycyl-tRNA synthetase
VRKTRAALEGITDLDHYTGATTDLTHVVAEFFDQVYVMDDNPERRAARLGLLAAIAELGKQTLAWEHLHT